VDAIGRRDDEDMTKTDVATVRGLRKQSALPDPLRVTEAVDLFATSRARDGGEMLERFGLAGRRRGVFSSLSGSERQRLFLVFSLLNRPRLVIRDELTQGLDPAVRRNVWAAVRQLHHEGVTGTQAIGMDA
jgi:ABC-2 type transport system ATP-binding protein